MLLDERFLASGQTIAAAVPVAAPVPAAQPAVATAEAGTTGDTAATGEDGASTGMKLQQRAMRKLARMKSSIRKRTKHMRVKSMMVTPVVGVVTDRIWTSMFDWMRPFLIAGAMISYLLMAVLHDAQKAGPVVIVYTLLAIYVARNMFLTAFTSAKNWCWDTAYAIWGDRLQLSHDTWLLLKITIGCVVSFLLFLFFVFDVCEDENRVGSLLGLAFFILTSYVFSHNRRSVFWLPLLKGLSLMFLFTFVFLRTYPGWTALQALAWLFRGFISVLDSVAAFIFGSSFRQHFLAFKVFPTIIFCFFTTSVLFHLGLVQTMVERFSWILMSVLKTSGLESLGASVNVFLNFADTSQVILPYLSTATSSELHAIMTAGFSSIAFGVFISYISFGNPAEHLILACILHAPAALMVSKIVYPETKRPYTEGEVLPAVWAEPALNTMDAAYKGMRAGMRMIVTQGCTVLTFVGLIQLFNSITNYFFSMIGWDTVNFETVVSLMFWPFALLLGVKPADCRLVAAMLAKRTFFNDFITYLDLRNYFQRNTSLRNGVSVDPSLPLIDDRSAILCLYAICGFANLQAIGGMRRLLIMLQPKRHEEVVRLASSAMIAGTIACFITANIVGVLI